MNQTKNPEDLLRAGETIQFAPTGFSMYPFLNPQKGDQVIVEPVDPGMIKRGDVVLYRRPGEVGHVDANGFEMGILVLHRVWKIEKNSFYFVGDNQQKIEGPVAPKQIVGRMCATVRGGKEQSVDAPGYALKAKIWLYLRPFRGSISRFVAKIKKSIK